MDFIALALKSDAPMEPVRVVTPSGKAVLPLRMVMAGTGSSVDIVLYLIGEGRLGLVDLTETHIDTTLLSYDYMTQNTNYEIVRRDALGENLGASYLTTFASKNPFGRTFSRAFQTSRNCPAMSSQYAWMSWPTSAAFLATLTVFSSLPIRKTTS